MRVRRDISAIPFRSASETWQCIVDLVVGQGSNDAHQLKQAANVICSIITDEIPADSPIVFEGAGPQLRIYLQYGMSAVEDGVAADALTWNPTDGDWTMRLPCDEDNIVWVKKALASCKRIKVFDVAEEARAEAMISTTVNSEGGITVDWNIKG